MNSLGRCEPERWYAGGVKIASESEATKRRRLKYEANEAENNRRQAAGEPSELLTPDELRSIAARLRAGEPIDEVID